MADRAHSPTLIYSPMSLRTIFNYEQIVLIC